MFFKPLIHPRPWMQMLGFVGVLLIMIYAVSQNGFGCQFASVERPSIFDILFMVFGIPFTYMAGKLDPDFKKFGSDNFSYIVFIAFTVILPSMFLANELTSLIESIVLPDLECGERWTLFSYLGNRA